MKIVLFVAALLLSTGAAQASKSLTATFTVPSFSLDLGAAGSSVVSSRDQVYLFVQCGQAPPGILSDVGHSVVKTAVKSGVGALVPALGVVDAASGVVHAAEAALKGAWSDIVYNSNSESWIPSYPGNDDLMHPVSAMTVSYTASTPPNVCSFAVYQHYTVEHDPLLACCVTDITESPQACYNTQVCPSTSDTPIGTFASFQYTVSPVSLTQAETVNLAVASSASPTGSQSGLSAGGIVGVVVGAAAVVALIVIVIVVKKRRNGNAVMSTINEPLIESAGEVELTVLSE